VIASTRFSVLDRSRTREGHDGPEALRDTVRFARELDGLGYHRVWVAEHHGVPGVAGSAPTVLAAAVAAATRTIRVGTGGVMLPNHQPLVVAEQFGVLESLFPGRIDMGLGRSVGFTGGVRKALGRDKDDADDFAAQLAELLDFFRGTSATGVRARPSAHRLLVPEAWSMAYSRTHGTFPPLPPAERVEALTMTAKERDFYESGLRGHIAGTQDQVADGLETLIKESGAQEVLVTTSSYDREGLLESYRGLARVAGLRPA
jgi:alkanesulfonate monooxygenase SsuD/methylene tetrahydromethanopterin reductase-like flavin-dependent oxidoreductase (luciferase family)